MNVFRLAGYDKDTDVLAVQHDLPADRASDLRLLARMNAQDDGFGCYRVDVAALGTIGDLLGWPPPIDVCDWFVEQAHDQWSKSDT